jgi:nucleoside phosphorylase
MRHSANRGLYLSFLNRELQFIKTKPLTEPEIIRFTKICALMSGGGLYASFAQVHELSHGFRSFSKFIAELCRLNRMFLINGEQDFKTFIERRQSLYAINKGKFPNYFGKKQPLSELYKKSTKLRTTEHIKSQIQNAANGTGPNWLSADHLTIINENKSFIKDELPDSKFAATFSVYEKLRLTPTNKAARVLGDFSTKLFCQHYATEHDLVAPSGIYNDPFIEDFELFPLYDTEVVFCFLRAVGLERIVMDEYFEREFYGFISSDHFFHFCVVRNIFFEMMINIVPKIDGQVPAAESFKRFIRDFGFTSSDRSVFDAEIFAERVSAQINKARIIDGRIEAALDQNMKKKLSRIRIAFFTATDLEDEVLHAQLMLKGFKRIDTNFFDDVPFTIYTYLDALQILHVRTSAGSGGVHGSGLSSAKFLAMDDLSYAYSVGICFGSYPDKQKLGDVIVSDRIEPYELAAVRGGSHQRRGIPLVCDNMAIAYARGSRISFSGKFSILVGPMLSGEKLVDEASFRQDLLDDYPHAIGGEMEGHGLAASARDRNVPFALIKGICDFASGKKDDHQEIAATNAITLAVAMVISRWGSE